MTPREITLVEAALDLLWQLPSGIDPDGVDESDTSPADAESHIGSIAARRLMEALGTYRGRAYRAKTREPR